MSDDLGPYDNSEIITIPMVGGDIKIVFTKPPFYDILRAKFGLDWNLGKTVVVYGNTIHQSFRHPMDHDLLVHEMVHVKQHREYPGGPEAWWKRYIDDVEFRISQELEAYRKQYQWVLDHTNREYRRQVLEHCARDMSSKLYGNVMSYDEAKNLLKSI